MSFPSVAGVRYVSFFQVVIPECRSRESVVNVVSLFHNNRSPTETFGDDNKSGTAVIPECSWRGAFGHARCCLVVIPECRSRESVVVVVIIKKGKFNEKEKI